MDSFPSSSPYLISLVSGDDLDYFFEAFKSTRNNQILNHFSTMDSIEVLAVNRLEQTNCYFFILILDQYGQLIYDEFTVENFLVFFKNDLVKIDFKKVKGMICANKFTLLTSSPIFGPLTVDIDLLKIKTNMISTLNSHREKFYIRITFQNCGFGEMLDSETNECTKCPRGTFSFEKNLNELSNDCQYCYSKYNFYCYGADKISPKPGYWRSGNTILKCPGNSCLGDVYFEQKESKLYFDGILSSFYSEEPLVETDAFKFGICQKGYKGPLCGVCEEKFGLNGEFTCTNCSFSFQYIKAIVFFFLRIIFYSISVRKMFDTNHELVQKGILDNKLKSTIKSPFIIGLLTYHFQILSIMFVQIKFQIFSNFDEVSSFIFQGLSQDLGFIFSQECFYKIIGVSNYLSVQHFSIILVISFDILIFLIISLLWFRDINKNLDVSKKLKFWPAISKTGPIIFVYLIFSNFLGQVQPFINQFICVRVDGQPYHSENYLFNEFNVNCNDFTHLLFMYLLSLPLILLLVVILPVKLGLTLFLKRKQLYEKENLIRYGFFYAVLRPERFYYILINIIKNIVLLALQTSFIYSSLNSDGFKLNLMLILLFFLWFEARLFRKLDPLARPDYNELIKLTKSSSSSLLTTIFSVIFLNADENTPLWLLIVIIIPMIILNTLFASKLLVFYLQKYYNKIKKIRKRLKSFCFMLIKYCRKLKPKRSEIIVKKKSTKIENFFQTLASLSELNRMSSPKMKLKLIQQEVEKLNADFKRVRQKKKLWKARYRLVSDHLRETLIESKQPKNSSYLKIIDHPTNHLNFKLWEDSEHSEEASTSLITNEEGYLIYKKQNSLNGRRKKSHFSNCNNSNNPNNKHNDNSNDNNLNSNNSINNIVGSSLERPHNPFNQSLDISSRIITNEIVTDRSMKTDIILFQNEDFKVSLKSKRLNGEQFDNYFLTLNLLFENIGLRNKEGQNIIEHELLGYKISEGLFISLMDLDKNPERNSVSLEFVIRIGIEPGSVVRLTQFKKPKMSMSFRSRNEIHSMDFEIPLKIADFSKILLKSNQLNENLREEQISNQHLTEEVNSALLLNINNDFNHGNFERLFKILFDIDFHVNKERSRTRNGLLLLPFFKCGSMDIRIEFIGDELQIILESSLDTKQSRDFAYFVLRNLIID